MTGATSSGIIESRIEQNRARRARNRRLIIAVGLAALALQFGVLTRDPSKSIEGLVALLPPIAIIGGKVIGNWRDEAYRLFGLHLAFVAAVVLSVIAVGTALTSAVTGHPETAVSWDLPVLAASLLVATLWLEPDAGDDD